MQCVTTETRHVVPRLGKRQRAAVRWHLPAAGDLGPCRQHHAGTAIPLPALLVKLPRLCCNIQALHALVSRLHGGCSTIETLPTVVRQSHGGSCTTHCRVAFTWRLGCHTVQRPRHLSTSLPPTALALPSGYLLLPHRHIFTAVTHMKHHFFPLSPSSHDPYPHTIPFLLL